MSIQASRTVAGLIFVAIILALFWYMKRDTGSIQVTTFEECEQAGYTVVGTSPETCRTPEGTVFIKTATASVPTSTSSSPTSSPAGNESLIRVTNVVPNQKITSPLTVTGEARGNWFFEASFPVKILDGNGQMIAQMPAQAIGEWMTSEFVPFKVVLSFAKPSTATGTLMLNNDNPSGLPENDKFISIPIRF
jgi:hypothetical protein